MSEAKLNIIQLDEFDGFPAYVAIYAGQAVNNPFVLSPVAMQWSEQIVLNRVQDCEAFWITQKNKIQCDYHALFAPVLAHHYGEDFIAVFACHPWQCLLYLAYLIDQKLSGVYFLQSRLHQNIYRSLDWQTWFANQEMLTAHFEFVQAKGFRADRFRSRQAQLTRFINRTGFSGPFQLPGMSYQVFSRRFGTWLASVRRWTMQQSSELRGFPWISVDQPLRPLVVRDLEYPVNQWQVVELLLREDLQRLCELFMQDEQEHINRMVWLIRLFNHQLVEVELSFRHPYSLYRDQPGFKTALYQARYIYDDLMRDLQARDSDLDLPETMPLLDWQIEVCESFSLPPVIWDLFGHDAAEIAHEDILNLQNKLPVTLDSYCYTRSFFPEQCFSVSPLCEKTDDDPGQLQWISQSLHRPLFYYQSVDEIEVPVAGQFTFLERCANDWWEADDTLATNRDYYILKNPRGAASWVYRDFNGRWFKQGEYC